MLRIWMAVSLVPLLPKGYGLGPYPHSISPDGKRIATVTSDGIALVSVDGGDPQPVRGSQSGETPIRWTKDGNALLVGKRGETSCTVYASRPFNRRQNSLENGRARLT